MPEVGPKTLNCPLVDQVSVGQPCKTERLTKSLPSNPARWSSRPSPYRATLRSEAVDQVSAKQPYEAERPTKSLPSNPVRQSGQSSLCRVTLRGGADDQASTKRTTKHLPSNPRGGANDQPPCQANQQKGRANPMLLIHVSMTRHITTKPRPGHECARVERSLSNTIVRHHVQYQMSPN